MFILKADSPAPFGHSPELMLELGRLEREMAKGLLTTESARDSLRRLQETSYRKNIRPFHTRGLLAALLGMGLLVLWINVECIFLDLADRVGNWIEALPVLGLASLVLAAAFFTIYFKRTDEEALWFSEIQGRVDFEAFKGPGRS